MESPDEVTLVPHTTIRKRIARHMLSSSAAAAHAYAMIDVDYSAVDEVRSRKGPRWRQEFGYSLTYLPFVARAVAIAIEQYPNLNSRFTDSGLELRRGWSRHCRRPEFRGLGGAGDPAGGPAGRSRDRPGDR
jgi:pyruvate/2-oxoglutarate dehydrogenase complex dihydrolipoamide acyltransferase (E2) component